MIGNTERHLNGPTIEAVAVRVEWRSLSEEEADATSTDAAGTGPAAGVMIAGAVAVLGHRVILGPGRRRRPLSAAFRPMVR